EPPRPCGHWNLNPARLPIPPPAHWVCPRALVPWGPAPSDTQNISTLVGVDSHPFAPPPTRPATTSHDLPRPPPRTAPGPFPSRRAPCDKGDCSTYQPRTGRTRLPRSRTETTVRCGTLVF